MHLAHAGIGSGSHVHAEWIIPLLLVVYLVARLIVSRSAP